jgi:hypothetical protein
MKRHVIIFFYIIITSRLYAENPTILYFANQKTYTFNKSQIGIVKDFNTDTHVVLHQNIEENVQKFTYNPDIDVLVNPHDGRYAIFITSGQFEDFTFRKNSRHIVFGKIGEGLIGFTPADAECVATKCFEHPLKFSKDDRSLYSYTAYFYSNRDEGSYLNSYDISTMKLSRLFHRRFDRNFRVKARFYNTVLSVDERIIAFGVDHDLYLEDIVGKKPPQKIYTVTGRKGLDSTMFLYGDFLLHKTFELLPDGSRKIYLEALDLKSKSSRIVFTYAGGKPSSVFPPMGFVYDDRGNVLFLGDIHRRGKLRDIWTMDLKIFELRKIIEDAVEIFHVSKHGNLLLYMKYKEPPDLRRMVMPTERNPYVIAVYDLTTGRTITLEIPGVVFYQYMSFIDR